MHASTTRARTVLRRFATHTPDDTSHLGECGAARYTLRERNPYDVHVYYSDAASKAEALALRERMQAAFPWMRFHSPKDRPIGPHPCPMWECDFADFEHRGKWSEVSRWVAAHHGDLSVLIHPHSTDGAYADHTENAFWAGDPLPLRIAACRAITEFCPKLPLATIQPLMPSVYGASLSRGTPRAATSSCGGALAGVRCWDLKKSFLSQFS